MTAGEITQILVGFGALVAFLTGFSSLRQRQRLEFMRESVRTANERLEDLAERQDALPLPATAINQELRPAATDPLGLLVITLSVITAASVTGVWWRTTQEGAFASQGSSSIFSFVAVTLIVVTAGIGVFDVAWGRKQIRLAMRYHTVRQIAIVLLRFLVIGRLILIQQLHRSLAIRLDPTDPGGAARDAEILRRIAQLPRLLGGAGVPPWIVARARRRADRALATGRVSDELPLRAGLEELHAEATRASLLLRQLRPATSTWTSFSGIAEDLRRGLPEWEWLDLIAAWIAAGLMPPVAEHTNSSLAATADRLRNIDYQRALGIHDKSRETDSRDLAAWSIADAIDRRVTLLDAARQGSGADEYGVLWDLPPSTSAAAREALPLRTSIAGFRSRDPFVWLALSQPSIGEPPAWVSDHFVIDEEVRWRTQHERGHVSDATAAALVAPPRQPEPRQDLDGELSARLIGHPANDVNPLHALRTSGARDVASLFRRYSGTDMLGRQLPRTPLSAHIEGLLSPVRWFGSLSRLAQALILVGIAAFITLLRTL
jgi:hypothetical protein